MTYDEVNLGLMRVKIGLATVHPAEFTSVLQFSQYKAIISQEHVK